MGQITNYDVLLSAQISTNLNIRHFTLCQARKDKKNSVEELAALEKVNHVLSSGRAARQADLNLEERDLVKGLMLLTMKPVIYAANVADNDLATGNELSRKLVEFAKEEGSIVVLVSAQVHEIYHSIRRLRVPC